MNTFQYKIEITVEVAAFDEDDAWDLVQDVIATGPMTTDVTITDCEYKNL